MLLHIFCFCFSYDRLLKEKEELEAEFSEYRQDAEGGVNFKEANEIRILKDFIKTLEKEICDHQRIIQKRKDQYRKVLNEVNSSISKKEL